MNFSLQLSSAAKFLPLLLAVVLAGCGRNETKVYTVPKEAAPAPDPVATMPAGHPDIGSGMGAGMGMGMPARPGITYKAPHDWNEVPAGSVRVASFKVSDGGKQADVSVIPLGGAAGGDVANVNRWRGQVGLEEAAEEELKKSAQPVEIAGTPADLYEISGKNPGNGASARILAAIQHRDGLAWFFKMIGDDELVAKQKPAFVEFLKTVKFEAPAAAAMPAAHPPVDGMTMPGQTGAMGAAPVSNEGKPNWQVPADWQETAGGQFLVAKFILSGEDKAQAAVNVSASTGDGGGFANNVNRWRRQLGIAEQSETEINKLATSVEIPGGKTTLVDISGTDARTGQPARLIGAMVSQGDRTWFYKLMGDAKLVGAQKDAFEKFVQSVKY